MAADLKMVVNEFKTSSQPKYGDCPPLGEAMDKSARTLLRQIDENGAAYNKISTDYTKMKLSFDKDLKDHVTCYLSEIMSKFWSHGKPTRI